MAADQPERPGLSARIQYEITGGPEGDVSYFWILEDGRLQSSAAGTVDAPDVTLTIVWDDAAAMQRGEMDPNVAFMQGRMKVAGSMGVMMALLPVTNTPEYQDLRRRIAAVTEF
jgi:putative sterol carrier protein